MDAQFDFRLIRPADLFVAQVTFDNLVVDDARQRLVRVRLGQPASVEFELPTQHFAEPSFDLHATETWALGRGGRPVPAVVPLFAGSRTRIKYHAPDGADEFPLARGGIVGAICDWPTEHGGTWVDVLATLWLRPPDTLRITADPPVGGGKVPLWSARVDVPPGEVLTLPEHEAYDASWNLPEGRYGVPPDGRPGPVLRPPRAPGPGRVWRCTKLLLTALGGTASIEGPDPGIPPYGHTHRTSLGRTAYVRQVVAGHLSSGHRASLVTVAERRLEKVLPLNLDGGLPAVPEGAITHLAVLLETTTLVIDEPYVDLTSEAIGHGANAFVGMTITTGERRVRSDDATAMQWIRDAGGGYALFDLVATDHAGTPVALRTPLAFIPDGTPSERARDWVTGTSGPVPEPTMPTQRVVIAPGENTAVTVHSLRRKPVIGRTVPVVWVVNQMRVVVDQLTGVMGRPPVEEFCFHELYDAAGLDPDRTRNPQGALLQIVPPSSGHQGHQLSVPLPGAAVGGVANPGLKIGALTTRAGAVAGELARQAAPSLADIRAAFPNAKLFGSIDLLALLADQPFADVGGRVDLPSVTRRRTPAGEEFSYAFTAALRAGSTETTVVGEGARLSLRSTATRRHDGQVVTSVTGSVTGIGITLFDVVTLRFGKVTFRSDAGTTAFEIRDPQVEFGNQLEIVAQLAEHLKELGQGPGVRVDVDADGVTAGFGLAIPSVAMMAMQFSNLTVDAWLRLPFTGAPMAFTLAVASRERPFLITVSIFGGGGWFALEVSPAGVRRLELGLEFGGSLSLDIIVASGGVTVMAGVYIGWDATQDRLTWLAYLRASGHVSVLGIVTVFVEFLLELGFDKQALDDPRAGVASARRNYAVLSGKATVKVGIEVLFFSRSVTLTVERTFIGSEADPTFLDCVSHDDWNTYCDAFASEPAVGGG